MERREIMDALYRDKEMIPSVGQDTASDLDAWFAVSGDMDDFIYFGDITKDHSEK